MPVIGWIFLLFALGLVLGSLFLLRDSNSRMPMSADKKERIRKRAEELQAREKAVEKKKEEDQQP
ncbi:MAG: DUF2897 family protein [Oleiphilaceae bacterium]|nr:DUF2897 family protein [Oleiphilaceae bacterium]